MDKLIDGILTAVYGPNAPAPVKKPATAPKIEPAAVAPEVVPQVAVPAPRFFRLVGQQLD